MAARTKASPSQGYLGSTRLTWLRVLLLGAAAIAGYLAFAAFQSGGVAGCGPQSGCHSVLSSRWAYWFGLPVSVPALGVYVLLLATTIGLGQSQPPIRQRQAWLILIPGAWVLVAAALWFVVLQAVVLRSFCFYCLTAHALASAASIVLLVSAPFKTAPEKRRDQDRQVFLAPRLAKVFFLVGLGLAAVLVAGQTLHTRATFKIEKVAAPVVEQKGPDRTLQIFGGKYKLNLDEVPIIGSPTASNVMLSLFDYTCHHCRTMHPRLINAQQLFGDRLAIVNLPMPLDERCNLSVRPGETSPDHLEACDQARLGLAVWRTRPDRMHEFDEWMFKFPKAPPFANAKAFAQRLVGPVVLEKALAEPWVYNQISNSIAIHTTAFMTYNNGRMPQLIIGSNITAGVLSMENLFHLLETEFQLRTETPSNN